MAETLLGMLQATSKPNTLQESALIVIDAQREYIDGNVPLVGVKPALKEIAELIDRARKLKTKVIFVRHIVGDGAPIFNPKNQYFQIADEVAPLEGETIIDKHHPSSFAQTNLHELLKAANQSKLIVTGFMTHACVSATVRTASELGYNSTVVAQACATRDLPGVDGAVVPAIEIHGATMAALQDLFATIVPDSSAIKD